MVAVAVGLAGGGCVSGVTGRLLVSLLSGLSLSFSNVVELIFRVQLHVHFSLHPQLVCAARVLAVAGCGGLRWPVRPHVIGY